MRHCVKVLLFLFFLFSTRAKKGGGSDELNAPADFDLMVEVEEDAPTEMPQNENENENTPITVHSMKREREGREEGETERHMKERFYQSLFKTFMQQYKRTYADEELFERYAVFKSNYDFILKHNKRRHSYSLAMNQFTDLTQEEFAQKHLGFVPSIRTHIRKVDGSQKEDEKDKESEEKKKYKRQKEKKEEEQEEVLPLFVDWHSQDAVVHVKDQQACRASYAFAAVGAVEGAWAVASGKLTSLSEQEIIDCTSGCNGGNMEEAFQYTMENNGICKERDYSFQGEQGTCTSNVFSSSSSSSSSFSFSSFSSKIAGYERIKAGDEHALLKAISRGPVSVALHANTRTFQFYASGIFDDPNCGDQLDHALLLIGYGTEHEMEYYIAKNSWSTEWGENGYMYIARGRNQCGLTNMASYPII